MTALFKKELKEERGWIIGGVLSILALEVFLYTRIGVWEKGIASGVSLLPLIAIPLLSLIRGYRSFKREWDTTSAIFLLSLPVNRFYISLAKTLPIIILSFLLTFCTTLPFLVIIHKELKSIPINYFILRVIELSLLYGLISISLGMVSLSSYIFSRCVRRLRTLLGFFSFFLFFYLYFKLSSLLGSLPSGKVRIELTPKAENVTIGLSGIWILTVLALIFWFLAGYLLERRVEC